jgi:hypothetical protein
MIEQTLRRERFYAEPADDTTGEQSKTQTLSA